MKDKWILGVIMAGVLLGPVAYAAPEAAPVSVPVLRDALDKGITVTAEMLTSSTLPAQLVLPGTVKADADIVGLQTVRPLPAGEVLNKLHFRLAPVVARGHAVTMRYTRGGIELLGQGQALEDGKLGQNVKVINPSSRATLTGKVTGPDTVTLE